MKRLPSKSLRIVLVALALMMAAGEAGAQVSPAPPPPVRVRPSRGGGDNAGVTFGSGGGSGLGFGIGAAGVALGLGFIGSQARQQPYTGQNSTPLVTGPPQPVSTEDRPIRTRHVRSQTQTVSPRRQGPRLTRPAFALPNATAPPYVPGEILLVVKGEVSPARLKRLETRFGLTPLASARIDLLDADVRRYRLKPGVSVAAAVAALRGNTGVASVQPNYRFELQIDAPAPPEKADVPKADGKAAPSGPVQYAVDVLHLTAAHRLATGADVRVAIIDSGVDETNPDLRDAVVDRFDAVGGSFKPHSHGTAIGGAIVAHHTLVGIAPKAKLIAIRAFAGASSASNGTGFDILRGLDFAAAHGARIVNMSFAGPHDLLLETALEAARKRGIIIVAAAGNAGPLAKPLYPAAEPGIIAVTATDAAGRPFAQANRGAYIAVAAPGVNIIAPGLGDSVQITSGTSIATAEASGVIALILEKSPGATPERIRKILSTTARRLTVEPEAGGAGVIDAEAALSAAK